MIPDFYSDLAEYISSAEQIVLAPTPNPRFYINTIN